MLPHILLCLYWSNERLQIHVLVDSPFMGKFNFWYILPCLNFIGLFLLCMFCHVKANLICLQLYCDWTMRLLMVGWLLFCILIASYLHDSLLRITLAGHWNQISLSVWWGVIESRWFSNCHRQVASLPFPNNYSIMICFYLLFVL